MKNNHRRSKPNSKYIIQLPAVPIAGNKIFERIGAAVGNSRGYSLTSADFATIMGRPESTTSSWFTVYTQPHLVSCFVLLEQLTPEQRHRVVDDLCRELPLLDHPWLQHNPITVGNLKMLLAQNTGLTFIHGGNAAQRTFLMAALGHTFERLDRQHRSATGLDLHAPQWFVPVKTMLHLNATLTPSQTVTAIREVWPGTMSAINPLILLNGIWTTAPDLQTDIIALAKNKHVILAEQTGPAPNSLPYSTASISQILKISASRENSYWINVEIQRG
jgi:hypothetical protein